VPVAETHASTAKKPKSCFCVFIAGTAFLWGFRSIAGATSDLELCEEILLVILGRATSLIANG
jgi:hypothetical protein